MQPLPPKHLAKRPGRSMLGRDPVVVAELLILLVGMVLVMTLVLASTFDRPEPPEEAESLVAPAGDRPPAATASTGAAPTTAGGGQRPGPAAAGGNLLGNPGFETGLTGWTASGGATMGLVQPGKEGQRAASFGAGATPNPGIAHLRVAPCRERVTYAAWAWLRASRPGTEVKLNLLETMRGRRFAVDGVTVALGTDWRRYEVIHGGHLAGAWLGFEIAAPNLPPGASVWVDAVEVRLTGKSFTFRTTR